MNGFSYTIPSSSSGAPVLPGLRATPLREGIAHTLAYSGK